MSSPAKRRKKNDFKASEKPVHNLEYFFAKQKDKTQTASASTPNQDAAKSPHNGRADTQLSDEELARKLQEEWNREDGVHNTEEPERQETPLEGRSGGDNEQYTPGGEGSSTADMNGVVEHVLQPPTVKNTLKLQSTATDEDAIASTIPFDQSPLTFEPSKYVPDLKSHWAADGGHATYALLTRCFVLVNSTQSRIKIVDTLVNLLRTIIEGDPESVLPAVWLATNSIAPPYADLELGLGGSAISKALIKVCGLNNAGLRSLYNKYGDAGDVAFEAKKRQSFTLRKPKPLTIKSVYDSLVKIANSKGQGSQEIKQRIVERLLQDSRGAEESRYIVRTLVQHLRIGAVKTTMLIALSRAFLMSRPPGASFLIQPLSSLAKLKKEQLSEIYSHNEEIVKACFARRPNYNDLVPTLLEIGVCDELLLRCGLSMHIPLRPMLGSITRDLGEMLTKLQGRDFSCEFKYDGQRAQVHCDAQGKVTIFSRHLEVMTDKYPDLVALVPKIRGEGVSSFILEGEVVAIDRETGDLKPFQVLSNRARKDVVIHNVKIDVCLFAFDLMYLNGEELLDRPFRERRSLLRSLFSEIPNHFTWVESLDASSIDQEAVSDFFKRATENKCEGIMVKVLDNLPNPDLTTDEKAPPTPVKTQKAKKATKNTNMPERNDTDAGKAEEKDEKSKGGRRKALLATYEPDKRLDSWLKVKKDYNTSADTIDLIPIGAWHGNGRKCKWWSPILLAVRNPETGCLEAVTKCMSGFTDKFYTANRAKYDPDAGAAASDDDCEGSEGQEGDGKKGISNVRSSKPAFVEYNGEPAVWFEPQEVWECAFADITLSPTYTAAIGLISEERGLSLRFPRFLRVREDKSIEEASTSDFLAELYRKQETKAPSARTQEPMVDDEADDDD
ncbi:DNA ligase ATP-dependent [Lasiodiplodia theobromae]|uniref:DNA ligase n=1 Tax=Lasiodiplodia theobromae TaxID=45133 RepID=A0A5N5DUD9_9PEZI|nr:DNA ligase ATP-dependent [Lasiodiplodia theobromae]KAB2581011.1 DNA ligase 1 [Lasiodiplodia theobromae]KAF4542497.1 DNA ligase ATP-dependent [Lasiodiplodia theobromae]